MLNHRVELFIAGPERPWCEGSRGLNRIDREAALATAAASMRIAFIRASGLNGVPFLMPIAANSPAYMSKPINPREAEEKGKKKPGGQQHQNPPRMIVCSSAFDWTTHSRRSNLAGADADGMGAKSAAQIFRRCARVDHDSRHGADADRHAQILRRTARRRHRAEGLRPARLRPRTWCAHPASARHRQRTRGWR